MRELSRSFKPHIWVNVHSGMEVMQPSCSVDILFVMHEVWSLLMMHLSHKKMAIWPFLKKDTFKHGSCLGTCNSWLLIFLLIDFLALRHTKHSLSLCCYMLVCHEQYQRYNQKNMICMGIIYIICRVVIHDIFTYHRIVWCLVCSYYLWSMATTMIHFWSSGRWAKGTFQLLMQNEK